MKGISPHTLPASPERACCGGWLADWGPSELLKQYYPPRHSDYRDSAPEQLETVYALYQPYVRDARWTEGLCQMWWFKNKPVKHSVHIPCWDSFKWNPLKWRGPCFGRTFEECWWTGTRQMRWTRAVYAANLGREYVMPVKDIGRHGYKSDLKALCCMYFLMSCIFSCGIGQVFSCCGSFMFINFGAWYSCHARERLRRRYGLPAMCGLPPGIDDCLVHFFCFYCASHQELRELAVRGVDGPGMHILDVLPHSFPNAEGIEEAVAERKKRLEAMLARPPQMFRARKKHRGHARLQHRVADAAAALARGEDLEEGDMPIALGRASAGSAGSDTSSAGDLGWCRYTPPNHQEMDRSVDCRPLRTAALTTAAAAAAGDVPEDFTEEQQQQQEQQELESQQRWQQQQRAVPFVPVIQEAAPGQAASSSRQLQKSWSVAY